MEIIDERGFIAGRVNVIDALVALLLVVALVGVVSTTVDGSAGAQHTQEIVVVTTALPGYVVDAISTGPVAGNEVVRIEEKSTVSTGDSGTRLRLRVTLSVTETRDGLPTFRGERLYVGRYLDLDLGQTIVEGTITDMAPIE